MFDIESLEESFAEIREVAEAVRTESGVAHVVAELDSLENILMRAVRNANEKAQAEIEASVDAEAEAARAEHGLEPGVFE